MKRYLLIFISFIFTMNAIAIDYYESGNFKFTIIDNKYISLNQYLGDGASFSIPSSVDGYNYPVNELYGPSTNEKAVVPSSCEVKDIFIPSNIKRLFRVTRDNKFLETVTIENGDELTYAQSCFYFDWPSSSFKYLIIFNNNKTYFTSMNGGQYLFKDCKITLKFLDNSNETIRMYFLDSDFNDTKFGFLLSALKKRGTDIGSVSEISLSNNTNSSSYKMTFNLNPNIANELAFGAKVVFSSKTYTSTNILDKVNFTPPSTNTTTYITYNRTNTHDWNSVCLPFDIKESDFGTSCKIYTISAATNDQISLTRVETTETVVEAGTPCFIFSSADNWNLELSNVTISSNVAPKTINVGEDYQVIGSFTNETIGAGNYKLNSEGTEFGITESDAAKVTAFRCYIAPTSTRTNAPAHLGVNIDEEASITLVPNDAIPQKVKLYDLMGRPRKEGTQGIFIKSTR